MLQIPSSTTVMGQTRIKTAPVLACLALCCLCLPLLCGCHYAHKPLFPRQYHTVAIPIFDNKTFYRGVEFDLTEALIKQIELRTPYKVVPAASADTLLKGTIVKVDQRLLARRREGGVPEQMQVDMTVNFSWKDQQTGEIIRDRRGFDAAAEYVPTAPVRQPHQLAQHHAVEQLADDIVSTLQTDW